MPDLWTPRAGDDDIYTDERLCWANKASELSGEPTPCNERATTALGLCEMHDGEIRGAEPELTCR